MDFSHILNTSLPQKDKLLAYGFTQKQDTLVLQSPLQENDFYTLITLDIKNQKLTARFTKLPQRKNISSLMFLLPTAPL